MCGRYMVVTESEIIQMQEIFEKIGHDLEVKQPDDFGNEGEIFPGSFAPVITSNGNRCKLRLMKWGFSVSNGKRPVINARSETALSKNLFKKPLNENRCIIPSLGFFEWKKVPETNSNEKFYIQPKDSSLFLMAGIFRKNGDSEEFVILTMPAIQKLEHIHDRMPLFILENQIGNWLEDADQINYLMANIFTAQGITAAKE
jgi:putative SOS response-associated peptidase YedK